MYKNILDNDIFKYYEFKKNYDHYYAYSIDYDIYNKHKLLL